MFPNLALQSNPFLSRRIRHCLVVGATLSLPLCAQAQPAESEVVKNPGGGIPIQPDPALITPQELQTVTGGPTLVTYSGVNVPAKGAIQALAVLTPSTSRFLNVGLDEKLISVDWKDLPFWAAARELETKAGGRWESDYRGGLFIRTVNIAPVENVRPEPGIGGLIGAQTPFVTLYANSITRTSTDKIYLGENQGVETTPSNFNLAIAAYFDPKLTVRSTEVRQLKFQAKQGGPVIENPRTFWGNPMGRPSTLISKQSITIPPSYAAEGKMFRISGVLHTVLVTNTETWKIADLATADKTPKTIGTGRYSIERFEVGGDQLTLKLLSQAPPEQRILTTNASYNTLKVRDSQGRELMAGGMSSNGNGERNQMELRYQLRTQNNEPATGPYSFEWVIPIQTRSYDVPFEFRDIPLP